VTAYPEPQRTELTTLLREYTRYVIEEAWPLQRQGLVPPGGVNLIAFDRRLRQIWRMARSSAQS